MPPWNPDDTFLGAKARTTFSYVKRWQWQTHLKLTHIIQNPKPAFKVIIIKTNHNQMTIN
jgi:hypothetical protein